MVRGRHARTRTEHHGTLVGSGEPLLQSRSNGEICFTVRVRGTNFV